jgi:hypothetical protein
VATGTLSPWQRLHQTLLDEIRDLDDVTCRVPGAEDPIPLAEGMRWLEEGLQRGLQVDYRLVLEDGGSVLWLQRWSGEEPRPPWPEEFGDGFEEPVRE